MSEQNGVSAEVTAEEKKTRGRAALTPEQKAENERINKLFHGIGEHTITVGISVTANERAMLRSFAKSVSIDTQKVQINDVFAGILRRYAFDFVLPGEQFAKVNGSIVPSAKDVKTAAELWDKENGEETPTEKKVKEWKKQLEELLAIKTAFTNRGKEVPSKVNLAIDGLMALIDLASMESDDEDASEPVAEDTVPAA